MLNLKNILASLGLATAIGLLVCQCALAEEPAPKPDETGIVPGDLVMGNLSTYPGHMGIYIGKWNNLPETLRTKYAKVQDKVIVYSYDDGLKDSFLVADSYAPAVRLRVFAEQFTDYYTGAGTRTLNPKGALNWEGLKGGAVAWTGLAANDLKRWRIVEEALKMCELQVAYDDAHMQWDTTHFANKEYKDMKLDCISFCHVAYQRGAGIDLDVSKWPCHTPEQVLAHATEKHLLRAVLFEPVYQEAVLSGKWKGEASREFDGKLHKMALGVQIKAQGEGFQVLYLDAATMAPLQERERKKVIFKCSYHKDAPDVLVLTGGDDTATLKLININIDKLSLVAFSGDKKEVTLSGEMTKVRLKEVKAKK